MDARRSPGRAILLVIGTAGLLTAGSGCLVADNAGSPGAGFVSGSSGSGYGGGYAGGGYAGSGGGGSNGSTGSTACAGGATSNFKVEWTIEDASGNPSSCDGVAAAEMDLDMQNVDTNAEYHAVFTCGAMTGTSCALPPGGYSVAMRLRDSQGTILSEMLGTKTVYITAGQTNDLGVIPFDSAQGGEGTGAAGSPAISLQWTIEKADTHAAVTCQQAGAASVEVDNGQQKFDLPCGAGMGVTGTIAPGTYPVTLRLLNAGGTALSETQTMNVTISAGQVLDLGVVPFEVL